MTDSINHVPLGPLSAETNWYQEGHHKTERRAPLVLPTVRLTPPTSKVFGFLVAPAQVERISESHFSLQSNVRLPCLPATVEYDCLVRDPRGQTASCVSGTLTVTSQRMVEHCGLCRVLHATGNGHGLVRTASAKASTASSSSGPVLQLHVRVMLCDRADGLISQTVVRV